MNHRTRDPERVLRLQQVVLEGLSQHGYVEPALLALCHEVEALVDHAICSIMRPDPEEGWLVVGAAPCAPRELVDELDGLVPGELSGSCGTAFHTGEMVLVEDATTDPRWQTMRAVAERFGIKSCWSIPVVAKDGEILGTFAISRPHEGLPTPLELETLEQAGHLARIALEFERAKEQASERDRVLQAIVDGSPDPIFVKDIEGRYLVVNSAEAQGVAESAAGMLGRTDSELYSAEVAERCAREDRKVIESGEGIHVEVDFENPVAGRRTFLLRKNPLRDDRGRICGVVGVARDVTELKRTEAAMLQVQKLEGLGVLAGGIAHDFNNLLTGILGNLDLAAASLDRSDPTSSYVAEALRASERAAALTQQMLAYSGNGELTKEAVKLPELIEESGQLLAGTISRKTTLHVDFAPGLAPILADPTQIRQVVMNLLTNASESFDGEPGRVEVELSQLSAAELPESPLVGATRSKDRQFVRLRVRDDGAGMDETTLSRIFDPFFTTKFTGRGLGLAAVQGIVRGHHGALEVQSHAGQGTTIDVYLPTTRKAPVPETPAALPSTAMRGAVLVCDDEEHIRSLSRRILQRAGLDVITAVDGLDAATQVEALVDRIDVVLLDLTTPRLSGFGAWKRIKAIAPELPVILTSGYGEREAMASFPPGALEGFLRKPFRSAELRDAISTALTPVH